MPYSPLKVSDVSEEYIASILYVMQESSMKQVGKRTGEEGSACHLIHGGLLLVLFFDYENGGYIFL
jgi:hypothetical protein